MMGAVIQGRCLKRLPMAEEESLMHGEKEASICMALPNFARGNEINICSFHFLCGNQIPRRLGRFEVIIVGQSFFGDELCSV